MSRTLLLASAAIGAAILPLGAAQAQGPFDWNGFYVGVHGGVLTGDVTVHESSSVITGGNIQGTVVGGLVGYNFPTTSLPPIMFGVEADFGWANVHGNGGTLDCTPDYLYDLAWDAHFRARARVPMGMVTPFVAAGLALADLNITDLCSSSSGGRGGLLTGLTIGGGVDLNLAPNLALRGEVLYDVYGRKQYSDFSADFNAWTTRAALIVKLP